MATREIPAQRVFICDTCKKENAVTMSLSQQLGTEDSRPDYWATLTYDRDAYDHQGAPVGDASFKLLLCDRCANLIGSFVHEMMSRKL